MTCFFLLLVACSWNSF